MLYELILTTGYFDSGDTGVQTETRADGRVVILIKVQELPLISEVKFEGLRGVSESAILEALRNKIDLRPGGVYDLSKVKGAINVIRSALASNKQPDAVIQVLTTEESATSVALTFVIKWFQK